MKTAASIAAALCAVYITGIAYGAPRLQVVTIMSGAPLCRNNGDIHVFSITGSLMPSCGRLARETKAYEIPEYSNGGVIALRAHDGSTWWTLQSAVAP